MNDGYANIEDIEAVQIEEKLHDEQDSPTTEAECVTGAFLIRDARITRAVALKCAAVLWATSKRDDIEERTLKSARVFEKWLSATPAGGD